MEVAVAAGDGFDEELVVFAGDVEFGGGGGEVAVGGLPDEADFKAIGLALHVEVVDGEVVGEGASGRGAQMSFEVTIEFRFVDDDGSAAFVDALFDALQQGGGGLVGLFFSGAEIDGPSGDAMGLDDTGGEEAYPGECCEL